MVDRRLQTFWERELRARARLRAGLPESWRDDPQPAMLNVREHYVEAILEMRRIVTIPIPADDR